jgi:hypothetical protein
MGAAEQQQLLSQAHGHHGLAVIGPVLLMRAFSSGCAALTGIEAISDSVAAFRPVEWRNARRVLVVMVVMLAVMFSGISALAHQSGVVATDNGPTLLYQLGERIFGNGVLLAVLQLSTLLILLLAANTAYADFQSSLERYWALRWLVQEGHVGGDTALEGMVTRDGGVRLEALPFGGAVAGMPALGPGTRVVVRVRAVDYWQLGAELAFAGVIEAPAEEISATPDEPEPNTD